MMTIRDMVLVVLAFLFAVVAMAFAQQPPDIWKVSMVAPVSNVGQPGEEVQYYSLSSAGAERFMVMGDQAHPVIRFLEQRRGQMVTLVVTGGTPE